MPEFRIPVDSYVEEALPTKNNADRVILGLSNIGGVNRRAYLYIAPPFAIGDTISAGAKLILRTYDDWTGQTITVKRVTAPWAERTINWNNKPAIDAAHLAVSAAINGIGTQVEIDISSLLQDVADGADYFGLELTVSGAVARFLASSSFPLEESRPYISLEWSLPIEAPDNLSPDGGFAVSTNKPYLDWDFSTDDEERAQAELNVQVDDDPAFAAPDFDSGWVAATVTGYDLATSAYGGAPAGVARYFRVRVKDDYGRVSEWSDPAEFVYVVPPGITLDNPPPGADPVVDDPTPDIEHTVDSGSQEAVELVLVKIGEGEPDDSDDVDADDPDEFPEDPPTAEELDDGEGLDGSEALEDVEPPEELWTLPRTPTAETAAAVPEDLLDRAGIYQIQHRVFDAEDREALVNAPAAVETVRQFRYFPANVGIVPVDDLQIVAFGPMIELTWTYPVGEVVNFWCLRVDGKERKHRITLEETRVGATQTFKHRIWGAEPYTRHKYVIEAVKVVAGKHRHSVGNKRRYMTTRPTGIYLCDPHADSMVRIRGIDAPDVDYYEVGTTFDVVGGDHPKRVVDALGGYRGSVGGDAFVLGAKNRNRFKRMKKRALDRSLRLVWSDINIPVTLEEAAVIPSADLPPGNRKFGVSFGFFQDGEITWRKGSH